MKLTKTAIYDALNKLPKTVNAKKLTDQNVEAFNIGVNYKPSTLQITEPKLAYSTRSDRNTDNLRKLDEDTYNISATYSNDYLYKSINGGTTLRRRSIKDLTERVYGDLYQLTQNLHKLIKVEPTDTNVDKQEVYYQQIVQSVTNEGDYLRFLSECIHNAPRDRDEQNARVEFVVNWSGHYNGLLLR